MSQKKLHLESLRGFAALAVAVFHFGQNTILKNSFTINSWLMVDFFFVLSGYVIALSYMNRITNANELKEFQIKRFARIYPLHIFMLAAFVFVEGLKWIVYSKGLLNINAPFHNMAQPKDIISNIFLVQNFTNEHLSWNYPSWSISAEFYTYLLFGTWMLVRRKFKVLGWIMLAAIFAMSLNYIAKTGMHSDVKGYYRCFYAFFLGYLLFEFEKRFPRRIPAAVSTLFLGGVIMLICLANRIPPELLMAYPIAFAALIYALNQTDYNSAVIRTLNIKPFVYLGTISYGIYMIHALIWQLMDMGSRLIGKFIGFDLKAALEAGTKLSPLTNLWFFAGLVIVIGLSHLSFKYLEGPAKNFILGRK